MPEGVEEQARQALTNLGQLLRVSARQTEVLILLPQVADSDFSKVIKATVFLADIKDFAAVNEVYKEFFTEAFPARAAVQVLGVLGVLGGMDRRA